MDPVYGWILRLGLAGLFGLAAFHKASDPQRFAATLRAYQMLPDPVARALARVLWLVEGSVAVALVLPEWGRFGALGAGLLLAGYSLAIGANLLRGRHDIDCGCLGPAQRQPLSGWLLLRNALLLAGAGVASLPASARPLHWLDALTGIFALVALPLLFMALNQLAAQAANLGQLRGRT